MTRLKSNAFLRSPSSSRTPRQQGLLDGKAQRHEVRACSGTKSVTATHKAKYSDVKLEHMLADAGACSSSAGRSSSNVIVTDNLFGDMLSDIASMLTGSLGMLPSATLGAPDPKTGKRKAMYEPVHGSAPDIAGQGIANPIAMIASFAMCLRYSFAMIKEADALEKPSPMCWRRASAPATSCRGAARRSAPWKWGDAILESISPSRRKPRGSLLLHDHDDDAPIGFSLAELRATGCCGPHRSAAHPGGRSRHRLAFRRLGRRPDGPLAALAQPSQPADDRLLCQSRLDSLVERSLADHDLCQLSRHGRRGDPGFHPPPHLGAAFVFVSVATSGLTRHPPQIRHRPREAGAVFGRRRIRPSGPSRCSSSIRAFPRATEPRPAPFSPRSPFSIRATGWSGLPWALASPRRGVRRRALSFGFDGRIPARLAPVRLRAVACIFQARGWWPDRSQR